MKTYTVKNQNDNTCGHAHRTVKGAFKCREKLLHPYGKIGNTWSAHWHLSQISGATETEVCEAEVEIMQDLRNR